MKKLFAVILLFSSIHFSAQGESSFAKCLIIDDQTYVFEWDPFIHTRTREIFYYTLSDYKSKTGHSVKNCADVKFISEVPSEILQPLSKIEVQLPEDVLFSLQQTSEMAHVLRTEKTPQDYIQNHPNLFKKDSPEVLTRLKYDVGDIFTEKVLRIWSQKIAKTDPSCESLIGTCDFYLCQENKKVCGLEGYNLSFGYKYCSESKFKLLNQMTTALGKSWVKDVFTCLQRKNFDFSKKELTCSDVQILSYNSHPDCYAQAGFCDLKTSEKLKIFNIIKKEIFSDQTLRQGFRLLKICGEQK